MYIPDFITSEEESLFLDYFNLSDKWYSRGKRRMQAYGYKYEKGDYDMVLRETDEIPSIFIPNVNRINSKTNREFNQMTVNEYNPGQGINSHYDHKTRFGDTIAGISLGSGCTMIFENGSEKMEVYLEPRSLYIMRGDLRYNWKHCIKNVHYDMVKDEKVLREKRISLTFRIC